MPTPGQEATRARAAIPTMESDELGEIHAASRHRAISERRGVRGRRSSARFTPAKTAPPSGNSDHGYARLLPCVSISSTGPTSSSGSTSRRGPGHLDPGRRRGRRDARGRAVGVRHARGRRDAPRRRDRPRDRVVPQRPLGRPTRTAPASTRCSRRSSRCSRRRSRALGVAVWAMVDLEADDALASAARGRRGRRPRSSRCIICTPDKDLGQCVGGKVVQLDRRRDILLDADGGAREVRRAARVDPRLARARRRLRPTAFPGFRAGARRPRPRCSRRYGHLEAIPDDAKAWDVPGVRGIDRLAATLAAGASVADRFKVLATLRTDADVGAVDDWEWRGPDARVRRSGASASARRDSPTRAAKLAAKRGVTIVSDAVLSETVRPGIRQVTLNRPERLNAMNYALVAGLYDALDDAAADRDLPRDRAHRRGARLLRGARPERGREPAGRAATSRPQAGHDRAEVHRRPRPEDAIGAAADHRGGERRRVGRRSRARRWRATCASRPPAPASTSRSSASGSRAATSACRGCCRA